MNYIDKNNINIIEKLKRIIKYILMGFISFISLRYIPKETMNIEDVIKISAISSISFAVLDMISPSIKVINT